MMSESSERIRAFIAVRLDARVEAAVEGLLARLRMEDSGVSWTRPGNLHVTLRFLGGAVAPAMIDALRAQLRPVAGQYSPFEICVEGLGAFPNLDWPRVVWIGIKSVLLAAIAVSIEAAAKECGFAPQTRPFTAHLAIGRMRRRAPLPGGLRENRELAFGDSGVDGFALYRSTLGAQGPRYTILETYQLAKRAA